MLISYVKLCCILHLSYNFYMKQITDKKISQKTVKKNFTTVGLILVLYVLLVMFIPYAFDYYSSQIDPVLLTDDYLYYGIYFLLLVFGTLIPFFLLRKSFGIKLKRITRRIDATFVDLFVQSIVFYTVCIALTYVSNMIFNYFGLQGRLLSGIGLNLEYNDNILYILILLVVTPLLEEYAFRGVLLNCLSRYSKTFALYATSLLFALAHNNFVDMIPAFGMGIVLGKTSLRYKSIQPTIVIHILFNVSIYVMSILPASIITYMAYVLVAIIVIAFALIITGRYERISIQKSKSNAIANKLFYSRFTVILAMILMLAYTCLITFVKLK